MKDPQLRWILSVSGPEGVVEFALARCEMTRCAVEERKWLAFCNSAARHQALVMKREEEAEQARKPKPLSWEERRALLVKREQQRRYGEAHRGLERSWSKPSTQRQLVRTR